MALPPVYETSGWAYRRPAIPVPQPDVYVGIIGLRDHASAGGLSSSLAHSSEHQLL
jgi:hypothetical protein